MKAGGRRHTILFGLLVVTLLGIGSREASAQNCTGAPWIWTNIHPNPNNFYADAATEPVGLDYYFNFLCATPPLPAPSGTTAVDLIVYGIGDASDWGPNASYASIYRPGGHYGLWTATSSHWRNGIYWGQSDDMEYIANPNDCPEGELRYDDGNGGSSECRPTPILIDLKGGTRYRFTSAADGVLFDLNGDGVFEQTAWTREEDPDMAFLAIDRNGNGTIDSGTELFGNATLPGVTNGFDALARIMVQTGDGWLDENDLVFSELKLWVDRNHNGISEPDELSPASERLEKVGLGYMDTPRVDEHGNAYLYEGWALLKGNNARKLRYRKIYDVVFAIQ